MSPGQKLTAFCCTGSLTFTLLLTFLGLDISLSLEAECLNVPFSEWPIDFSSRLLVTFYLWLVLFYNFLSDHLSALPNIEFISFLATALLEGPTRMREIMSSQQNAHLSPVKYVTDFQELFSKSHFQKSNSSLPSTPSNPPPPITDELSIRSVDEFLRFLNITDYQPMFDEHQIDFALFLQLSDDDLKEIGIRWVTIFSMTS